MTPNSLRSKEITPTSYNGLALRVGQIVYQLNEQAGTNQLALRVLKIISLNKTTGNISVIEYTNSDHTHGRLMEIPGNFVHTDPLRLITLWEERLVELRESVIPERLDQLKNMREELSGIQILEGDTLTGEEI